MPETLRVDRLPDREGELLAAVRAWLAERERQRPAGVHVSDLLFPRRGYWRMVHPRPPSDRQVGYFVVGHVLHALVRSWVTGGEPSPSDAGVCYEAELEIYYAPDHRLGDRIVEIKTTRVPRMAETVDDLALYLRQLGVYLALERRPVGELWVLYLSAREADGRTVPRIGAYEVELPPESLGEIRQWVREARAALVGAVAARDHRRLPLCAEWLCSPTQCEWWEPCRPEGRYPEGGRR